MAAGTTIFRASIQLSDADRHVYTDLKLTLAQHPSETAEHLVARLLAYVIFYQPELEFTKGLSQGELPALWITGPDGRPVLWLDVGLPEPDRVTKACRHTHRVIVLLCGRNRARWEKMHLAGLAGETNLAVWGVDPGFLQNLVTGLEKSIVWTVTISGGMLYLASGARSGESPLTCLLGAAESP
jgi:uncharacterized protein YaeQ